MVRQPGTRSMSQRRASQDHLYRLVLSDDGEGAARTIEFEAASPDQAFFLAERQGRGRQAELLEDGRSLGRLQCMAGGGFWILSPP